MHPSFVSGFCPLPAFVLSVTKPSGCEAAPPSWVLSQMRWCFSLLRDCGFDPLRPSEGGPHQAMAECWPHPGTFAGPCCCRCTESRSDASPPQKKFTQLCCSSISGIMVSHNTHLALGFPLNVLVPVPVNVVVLWGLLGPLAVGRLHSLYQMSSQQGNHLSQGPPDVTLCS